MMAANANIGVARTEYFPSLTLGAQAGFESQAFSNWLSAPSAFWAIGPNALLNVFDGEPTCGSFRMKFRTLMDATLRLLKEATIPLVSTN
jgi:hypothetical protein